MEILSGHISQETAYVVTDYPYGFRLRCKIRYWLEYSPKRGYRLVSQTTNPKLSGEHWNAPKASTYQALSAVLFLNEEGHVKWDCLNGHETPEAAEEFLATYESGISEHNQKLLRAYCNVRRRLQEHYHHQTQKLANETA